MQSKSFYTVDEVAAILQVTDRTVRNLINRGRFPGAHKIDPDLSRSPYRIPKTDLEKFIQRQRKQIQ